MKFIYIGDMHIRGTNPRNRTDNYKDTLIAKIREVQQLAEAHDVEAILCSGDIFDKPEVSTGVLLEFADVFAESKKPWYTTPGNHDLYSYNLSTYWRTSLALLERLVPNFYVMKDPKGQLLLSEGNTAAAITFTPFTSEMDRDGYGYSPESQPYESAVNIHIAHGMLLDHTPPFDRFTLVQEVETAADLVLTGHDHTGYGIYNRPDGKTFVNLGSLSRMSASTEEISRTIEALLITVESEKVYSLERIPLKAAKPGAEVLDRSKIEAEQKRQYAMETFSALIQSKTGEAIILDIDSIVEQIAAQEDLKPEVVRLAVSKINDAKARL